MPEPITIFILGSILLFLLGISGGWILTRSDRNVTKSNLQVVVGIVVTIAWVVSIAAEIIIPSYTVSMLVHGIMGAVVGYLFSEDGLTLNVGGE